MSLMKNRTDWSFVLAGSLCVATSIAAFQQQPVPAPAAGQGAPAGPARGGGGFNRTPTFDKTPPELPKDLKDGGLLIFSKTNGFREEAAIQASNDALMAIAKKRGWPAYLTENAAVFNADQLKHFKVTVWNNTSGDTHTEEQRAAFKTWMENGGAFVGTHGAGGDPTYAWEWYPQTLIGAQFTSHSSQQLGTVRIEDRNSPITKGLPAVWVRTVIDEWYAFKENPRDKGAHILATADETTYNPGRSTMGADHPMVWTHCVGKGAVFYSAIGHSAATYSEPNNLQLLENAMAWALGLSGSTGCPSGK
jgi:type 1 glutamine amidotransferase